MASDFAVYANACQVPSCAVSSALDADADEYFAPYGQRGGEMKKKVVTLRKEEDPKRGDTTRAHALLIGLGKAIKEAREARELGQTDVADAGNLSRLERGLQWVRPERLAEISRILEAPVWTLFARAEGALDAKLWQIVQAYLGANEEGRDAIERQARMVRQHYQRKKDARGDRE